MKLLFLTLFPLTLQAQESSVDTIKIESNKEIRSLEQITESISVVPGVELDSPLQKNNIEVINALPNISINKLDGSFSIRGVNNTGVTGFAKDNVSSILLDDIYLTDLAIKAGAFDLWDVNHIEVFRGPQSTLQGINSLSGTISLFKNKASLESESAFKFGTGNYGSLETGLLHNDSAFDDRFRYRIAYNREQTDGYIENQATRNEKWGKRAKENLNIDLQYFLNEKDYLRFNTKISQAKNGGIYTQGANPFDYKVNEDIDFLSKTNYSQQSIRYFSQLSETLSNEIILAHSQAANVEMSDADWTATEDLGSRIESHDDRFISAENLLKYNSNDHQNILGVHTHRFYLKDNDMMTLVYGTTPIDVLQKSNKFRTVISIFDSYTYRLSKSHNITAGLRFEHVINDFQMDLIAPPIRTTSIDSQSFNNVLLPKLAYTYTREKSTYGFSVSEGYRTGGVSINRWQGIASQYSPEKTTNYELSFKNTQDQVKFYANFFYTDWNNQQVLVEQSSMPFDTAVQNSASSELYGAESEIRYAATSFQEVAWAVGYTKTRFKDFQTGMADYNGHEFPFAPQWTGRLIHQYRISDKWNTSVAMRYLGSSYMNAENTRSAPDQYYLDLGSQYFWSEMAMLFDFYIKNALNQQYQLLVSNAYNGVEDIQVSAPMEFGLRLLYTW